MTGVHVLGSGRDLVVTSSRDAGCVNYMVDRNNISADQGLSLDELVNPDDIAGMEFYQATDIPAELTTGANTGCALLVVWTKSKLSPH